MHFGNNAVTVMGPIQGDDVISHLVYCMHRARADIQNDVVIAQFVLMYHKLLQKLNNKNKNATRKGGIKLNCLISLLFQHFHIVG